jgi:hypothetical protein
VYAPPPPALRPQILGARCVSGLRYAYNARECEVGYRTTGCLACTTDQTFEDRGDCHPRRGFLWYFLVAVMMAWMVAWVVAVVHLARVCCRCGCQCTVTRGSRRRPGPQATSSPGSNRGRDGGAGGGVGEWDGATLASLPPSTLGARDGGLASIASTAEHARGTVAAAVATNTATATGEDAVLLRNAAVQSLWAEQPIQLAALGYRPS